MLAYRTDAVERIPIGYAQFGPLSAYPRAQSIRDRYPQLPESPAPWVVTCLQVGPIRTLPTSGSGSASASSRPSAPSSTRAASPRSRRIRRPTRSLDPSPGPAWVYEAAGFERAAGDDRFPVYRRELSGETDADAWSDLLRASRPDTRATTGRCRCRRSPTPTTCSASRPRSRSARTRSARTEPVPEPIEAGLWGALAASALVLGSVVTLIRPLPEAWSHSSWPSAPALS